MLDLAGYTVRAAFEKAVPGFPVLRCVEASTVLHFLLRALGYRARLVKGNFQLDKPLPKSFEPADGRYLTYAHHWVEVEDTVLDITGDQFDPALQRPWVPVYIGPRTDRYIDGVEDDQNEILEHPICQAVLFELRQLLPGWIPVEGPTGGLGAGDFTWWDERNPADQKAFESHLKRLGKALEERLTDMTFRRPEVRIGRDDQYAWITWAPPGFGDNVKYRYRPHITLDVKPRELVLHLNLELVDNARHFARLALADPAGVLRQIRQLDCGLELQVYQRREVKQQDWRPEQPVYYQVLDLTPADLREAVENARRWGEHEGTLPAYLLSTHMPAARAIALAGKLPDVLACWIERLRPGLEHFDRKRR